MNFHLVHFCIVLTSWRLVFCLWYGVHGFFLLSVLTAVFLLSSHHFTSSMLFSKGINNYKKDIWFVSDCSNVVNQMMTFETISIFILYLLRNITFMDYDWIRHSKESKFRVLSILFKFWHFHKTLFSLAMNDIFTPKYNQKCFHWCLRELNRFAINCVKNLN